ncbi:MAG: AraC family transcriptional regulator, partial [Terrimonas sp.]|nr:AraC family transcriptional regulator [Terrimonas sp.]
MENKLIIKNMVCNRCIMVVRSELEKLGYKPASVTLGEVVLDKDISADEKNDIAKVLEPIGFELIDDKKSRIIEKIKNVIIDLVHRQDVELKTSLSDLLSAALHHDYNYLSNL